MASLPRADRDMPGASAGAATATTGASVPVSPWTPYALMILAAWLAVGPWTFGYAGTPSAWSDRAGGLALFALGAAMLKARWAVAAQWATAATGALLLLSPLVLWAESSAAFALSTFAGSLAIAFSILLPRAPLERHDAGAEIPPGWSYNPSAWAQRAPIIAMAFLGYFAAQYMAAFQLGYHDLPWDPFFGDGTRRVLTSDVSRAFPVSDAGLGAVAYLIEALTGFAGGRRRWRTMPWMVLLFGVMVVPAGVISILLIVLQPIAVGAWCALCLFTALTTLLMISPAADEVVASVQVLARARRDGAFWKVLLRGVPETREDARRVDGGGARGWISTALGVNRFTPSLVLAALAGAWLMVSPSVLGSSGAAASSDHLVGPLVITFAVIAWAEVGRSARWMLVPLGAWLAAGTWFLDGGAPLARWNDAVAGLLLIALAIPHGKIEERFGGFERAIK